MKVFALSLIFLSALPALADDCSMHTASFKMNQERVDSILKAKGYHINHAESPESRYAVIGNYDEDKGEGGDELTALFAGSVILHQDIKQDRSYDSVFGKIRNFELNFLSSLPDCR